MEPDVTPQHPTKHPRLSRRSFLRAAGLGGGALAVDAASGTGITRYRDTAAARRRADGATVAQLSTATGVNVLWRAETDRKVMALTFDDGPGETLTAPLLDVLRAEKVRATFVVLGRQAERLGELIARQVRDGHELANHSWSHADLSQLSYRDMEHELVRTDELLKKLTGRTPAVVRPPFGRIDGALLQHVARAGQHVVLWDLRMQEKQLDTPGNAAFVNANVRPGSVLLAHDAGLANRYIGINAVPDVVRTAKARGYEFLTASEMIAEHLRSIAAGRSSTAANT
jgi:peptidoglycan/xylan/chitin deacetylase (PgdA/CDA1 family)